MALGNFATMCTGAAIGVGTAYVMEAPRMVVFSSAVTGLLGANAAAFANGHCVRKQAVCFSAALVTLWGHSLQH